MSEVKEFPQIFATPKTGGESFEGNGAPPVKLRHFWRWFASDLVSNATRGILAEYIVACALGINEGVRNEWDSYDLKTQSGCTIEVKSSAYIQSWHQKKLSPITFNIRPTRDWNPTNGEVGKEIKRQADIYVFSIFKYQQNESVNPLDLDQWDFYVLPTSKLNDHFTNQKSITLSGLLTLNPYKATYNDIAGCIEKFRRRRNEEPR